MIDVFHNRLKAGGIKDDLEYDAAFTSPPYKAYNMKKGILIGCLLFCHSCMEEVYTFFMNPSLFYILL